MSSPAAPSTSIMSSQDATQPDRTRSISKRWGRSSSRTVQVSPRRRLLPSGTGFLPGQKLFRPRLMHSRTGTTSWCATENILQTSSEHSQPRSTVGSSISTAPCESVSDPVATCSSPTSPTLQTSKSNSSTPQVRACTGKRGVETRPLDLQASGPPSVKRRHVGVGMLATVPTRLPLADSGTSAQPVTLSGTHQANALRMWPSELADARRPRYMRGLIWSEKGRQFIIAADASLTQSPLPEVPAIERRNPIVNATLAARPDLFAIVTPINVDHFQFLLRNHPNPEFVASVIQGLREGFWPWADAAPAHYPITWDEDRPPPGDEAALQFLRDQRDEEVALGRYSAAFGTELLPGMYAMPIHAVPKPCSDKLRLVNDHSAGEFSLNSLIRPESIKGVVLDGIPAFGEALRAFRRVHGNVRLIVWKSDVSQAYRRLPMSPYWQVKQVATFDKQRHVDRCNLFGSRAGQRLFAAFMCLVVWIAVVERAISHFNYVDDDFGFELEGRVEFYAPYRAYLPKKQAQLLKLWDEIGLPHEQKKQEYAPVLLVIGFAIDPNAMTVTMPSDSRCKLLDAIESFCHPPLGSRRHTLAEFQSLAGYANWAFNVFPLLKPGLCNLYAKMAGKANKRAGIYLNTAIIQDLSWMAAHIAKSDGVHMLDALEWGPPDLVQGAHGDEFALVDASGTGMGLYFPWANFGFHCALPRSAPSDAIFFFEALAIASALHRVVSWRKAHRCITRLAVLSDNTNAVAIFNTLRAEPIYNPILTFTVDLLIQHHIHQEKPKCKIVLTKDSRV
ncbi:hypothetical protein A0H81_03450 [Grifola frondosa]|uniref:Uncharacterized protein n=1 Tax=Grifola frondosa TaxID=5627 RepID=A0A1C7MH89_GRIFR|nr:hypothetical protein A0H81_03450 [Grifola frondosa]